MARDYWAEEMALSIENDSCRKDFEKIQNEIEDVDGPKFYKKYLLKSINECFGRKDLESITSLH